MSEKLPCFLAAFYCSHRDKSTSPPSPACPSPGWTIASHFLQSFIFDEDPFCQFILDGEIDERTSAHFNSIQIDIARMVESLVDAGVIVAGGVVVPARWKYQELQFDVWIFVPPHLPLLAEGELQTILVPPLADQTCVKLLPESKNERLKCN